MRTSCLALTALLALPLTACDVRGGGGGGDEPLYEGAPDDDNDGDGITNEDEVALGTNPASADSDGDGYSDKDEVDAGSDPTDEDDAIYQGGWPYNPNKGDLEDPGMGGSPQVGQPMSNVVLLDQFGDEVELFDFAHLGKPAILDLSAEWCPPCNDMAEWLDGADKGFFSSAVNPLREAVESGDILWITFLNQDSQGAPADQATAARWHEKYPTGAVPVLADTNSQVMNWIGPPGIPSLTWVDDEWNVTIIDNTSSVVTRALNYLDGL